jgi:hypothetical protein
MPAACALATDIEMLVYFSVFKNFEANKIKPAQ